MMFCPNLAKFRLFDYVYCLRINKLGRVVGGTPNGLVIVQVFDGLTIIVYLVSVDMLQYVCLN